MSAERVAYLDSSALVKLVIREAESDALQSHLRTRALRVCCALARVEVPRAVQAHGGAAVARADQLLDRIGLIALDDPLLRAAGKLAGASLRSLDAIHLAAARTLEDDLTEVITYDHRMTDAARALGLPVAAPA